MKRNTARHLNLFLIAAMLVAALGVASPASPAHAAMTITVDTSADNLTDDGLCTLREAVQAANTNAPVNGADDCNHDGSGGVDTIVFDSSLSGMTIAVGSQLDLSSDLTIDGSALASQVSISGGGSVRVFNVTAGAITLNNIKVINGSAPGGYGGGLQAVSGSSLTINNSTFSGNSADWGGGVLSFIPTFINNSTFTGNSATSGGGGFYLSDPSNTSSVINSTFSGNSSIYIPGSAGGGAIQSSYYGITLVNTTISGNTTGLLLYGGEFFMSNTIIANSTIGEDCELAFGANDTWNAYNLIEDMSCGNTAFMSGDPNLGPLQNNGGPTDTMALLSGSPAIDWGRNGACPATDQRGVTRPQGAYCDMGAFEVTYPAVGLSDTSLNFGNQLVGVASAPQTVTVTNTGGSDLHIGTLGITGDFGLSNDTCSNATLIPTGTCTFDVIFQPLSSGYKTGQVSIPSDAGSSPDTVDLDGTGVVVPNGTNLLKKPDFPSANIFPTPWKLFGVKLPYASALDCTVFQLAPCSVSFPAGNRSAMQQVNRSGLAGDMYLFGLSSMSQNAPIGGNYRVEVTFYNNFNRPMGSASLSFSPLTHSWETLSGYATATGNYNKIIFRFYYQNSSGRAWFDDAFLIVAP